MNLDSAKEFVNRFQKKYPFIKPELMRAGGGVILNRILAETRAGRNAWDVAMGRGETYRPLRERELLSPYSSLEATMYPEDLRDKEGYWYAVFLNANVLAFNTKLVGKEELPRGYQDLLNPKWKKQKLSIDVEGWALISGLSNAWGKEKAISYLRKVAAQQPAIKRGNALRASLVAAGETPIAIAYAGSIQELTDRGAPIDWIPLEPVVVQVYPMMLAAKAPNPNAAKLFIDFVLSKESQEVIRGFSRIPARKDVEPDPPRLRQFKRVIDDPGKLNVDETAKVFNEIFGLR
ncbi:MAG: extracellular solute-binding protein [Deltaproteobacteria bacterium]|nr:extracellular solute-binding protein [Deltaproteobacteria bacterium]